MASSNMCSVLSLTTGLCLAMVAAYFPTGITIAWMPSYLKGIGESPWWAGVMFAMDPVGVLATMVGTQMLMARFGRMAVLILGFSLLIVSAVLFAMFPECVPNMIAMRLVLGAGQGATSTSAIAIAAGKLNGRAFARAMGVQEMALGVSFACGITAGAVIEKAMGFRGPFLFTGALAGLAILLVPSLMAVDIDTPQTTLEGSKTAGEAATGEHIPWSLQLMVPTFFAFLATFNWLMQEGGAYQAHAEEMGWSSEEISYNVSMGSMGQTLFSVLSGWAVGRWGPHVLMTCGGMYLFVVLVALACSGRVAAMLSPDHAEDLTLYLERALFALFGVGQTLILVPSVPAMRMAVGPDCGEVATNRLVGFFVTAIQLGFMLGSLGSTVLKRYDVCALVGALLLLMNAALCFFMQKPSSAPPS